MRTRPRTSSSVFIFPALVVGLLAVAALPLGARQSPDLFKGTFFRDIGPTRQGNRFVDFAAVESMPRVFYAAAATGGLFKTENNGYTFSQVFDNQPVASLGAVAVSQSNPTVIYVGSGEGNSSRSSYWGNGIYVSTDGGATWTHSGLEDSHHIGRIVVHPTDSNTAYVAALGHLYSDNEERGVYKTVDGGKTWTKSLDVKSEGHSIGAADVAMDPKNPLILYASAYDRERRPWSFSATGPGSGLYKTIDGGKTWTKLAGGLPTGDLGRIGISIFRQDPTVVYAIVEVAKDATGTPERRANGFGDSGGSRLYRSDDAGKTWRQTTQLPGANTPEAAAAPAAAAAGRTSAAGRGAAGGGAAGTGAAGTGAGGAAAAAGGGRGGRGPGTLNANDTPYYYSQVRVDPNDKNHVFVLSTSASQSFDGGQTWQGLGAGGDNHALWIDPKDSKHMLLGYDHGISVTFDGGTSWYHPDNIPGAQAYAVGFDMATPYNVYVGLQDNSSYKGPSSMKGGGAIPFEAWSSVGGGDGQYNVVELTDSRYLYNEYQFGTLQRVDLWTGEAKSIDGTWTPPQGQCARCNWTSPVLVSPHDPSTLYFGEHMVLKSTDRGDTWQAISQDLTMNDSTKQAGTGNVTYATISTLDESPIVPGLLWAGTDDGNVQVTKDDGKTWTNVRDKIPGHPGYWVSRVEPSHLNPGTAYVTITGLRNDDFRPFIWKTTDFGQSWTSIVSNLPKEAINVVREDPRNANLLFVGTDLGLYVSLNGGQAWTKMTGAPVPAPGGGGRGGGRGAGPAQPSRGFFPTSPVADLKIQPRDHELIVATHGRGLFIADIEPYEELSIPILASDAHLFEIAPVVRWAGGERGSMASANFSGMSRPAGVAISYYLKTEATGDVKVRVFDGSRVIADMDGSKTAGINTVRWDEQTCRERIPGEAVPAGGRGGGGRGGRGGGTCAGVATEAGIGEYRVVLSVGGHDYVQTARIVPDPSK
jgi:photosystem II stability/assembly factor-like uncharacterized protein